MDRDRCPHLNNSLIIALIEFFVNTFCIFIRLEPLGEAEVFGRVLFIRGEDVFGVSFAIGEI